MFFLSVNQKSHLYLQPRLVQLLLVALSFLPLFAQAITFEQFRRHLFANEIEVSETLHLYNPGWGQEFYIKFNYQPQWLNGDGELTGAGSALRLKISQADHIALDPNDYHFEKIQQLLALNLSDDRDALVALELLFTDAFYLLAYHSGQGKLDVNSLQAKWSVDDVWASHFLANISILSAESVLSILAEQEPKHSGYVALKRAYQDRMGLQYSDTQRSFNNAILKPGQLDDDVLLVRKILKALNYSIADLENTAFDDELKKVVMEFQTANGLVQDGSIGQLTQQAMLDYYYGNSQKVAVNLERWRWLPKHLGDDRIMVNIASFYLEYVRDNKIYLKMKTVVGTDDRQTPLFSDVMRYIVVNPRWGVPQSIASQDILQKLQRDSDYLKKKNMDLFKGWGANETLVDAAVVDWNSVKTEAFPYHISQRSGPSNSLGQVKFIFPNQHDVYLHDTNEKYLFAKSYRAYSSGCVRVSQPLDLLYAIAEKNTSISREKIKTLLDSGNEATILLLSPLPVYLQYLTAWVDADDQLQYRSDIYNIDGPTSMGLQSSVEVMH